MGLIQYKATFQALEKISPASRRDPEKKKKKPYPAFRKEYDKIDYTSRDHFSAIHSGGNFSQSKDNSKGREVTKNLVNMTKCQTVSTPRVSLRIGMTDSSTSHANPVGLCGYYGIRCFDTLTMRNLKEIIFEIASRKEMKNEKREELGERIMDFYKSIQIVYRYKSTELDLKEVEYKLNTYILEEEELESDTFKMRVFTEKLEDMKKNYKVVIKNYPFLERTDGRFKFSKDELFFQYILTRYFDEIFKGIFEENSNILGKLKNKGKDSPTKELFIEMLTEENKGKRWFEKSYHYWSMENFKNWLNVCKTFRSDDLTFRTVLKFSDIIIMKNIEKNPDKTPYQEMYKLINKISPEKKILFSEFVNMLDEYVYKEKYTCLQMREKYIYLCTQKEVRDTLNTFCKICENKKADQYIRLCNDIFKKKNKFSNLSVRKAFLTVLDDQDSVNPLVPDLLRTEIEKSLKEEVLKNAKLDEIIARLLGGEVISNPENVSINFTLNITCTYQQENSNIFSSVGGKIVKVLNIAPFQFFHIGVTLSHCKVDWASNSYVSVRDVKSSKCVASFGISKKIIIPAMNVNKLVEFIFHWNSKEKYSTNKKNCQKFALDFLDCILELNENENKQDCIKRKNFLDKKSEAQRWINENSCYGGRKIVRKILLEKEFLDCFPFIKNKFPEEAKKGYYEIFTHENVFDFMEMFKIRSNYFRFKRFFECKLFLIKAFCRSFLLQMRSKDPESKFKTGECFFDAGETNLNCYEISLDDEATEDVLSFEKEKTEEDENKIEIKIEENDELQKRPTEHPDI